MELSRRREVQLYSDNLTDFCKDNQLYIELLKDHVDELEKMKQYDAAIKQSQTEGEIHRLAKSADPRNLAVMFTRMPQDSGGRLFTAHAGTGEYEDSLTAHAKSEDNPFCYLCSTIEQHKKHLLKTEKKIHGKKRIPYEAPAPFVPPKPPPPKPESKECLYRVTVKTGLDIKAACSAPVYITLRGEKGTLSRARLAKKFGSLGFFFDSGSAEVFHLRGPKIGRLTDLTVAMETAEEAAAASKQQPAAMPFGSEASKPKTQRHKWLLESVSVKDYAMGLEYHFNIDNWLRSGRRDKIRVLPTTTARSVVQNGRGILVTTYTGRKATSGTDCRVFISLLGANGARGRHELRRPVDDGGNGSKGIFQPGGKDVFELYVEDFGDLKGIRLELDTQSVRSSTEKSAKKPTRTDREGSRTWFIDQAIVKDIKTGQKWLFTISEWLNEDEPAKEFWTVKDVKDGMGAVYSQTTQYQIVTKTGKKDFAGTDSTIYLSLFDKEGRRCDIELRDDDKSKFEKGKTDTIIETARVIDTPVKMKVSISGKGVAPDWQMDGIVVTKYLVTEEILKYLQRLQFSNKMPDGLTQDKGKILFEAAERQRKKQKMEERKKSLDDSKMTGKKRQKKKTGKDRSSSKDTVDDGVGVFGNSRRRSSLKSSKPSSSDEDDDSIKSESDVSTSDSNDSVKSHDDYNPEHGCVRLPYAVQVSFAPRSKDDAWLKKDKSVELHASDAGKFLFKDLRLRSDNESFERIRQELLEKQRAEEEKKKKLLEKKRRKLQEQQEQRRAAARKSDGRSKSSRGRAASTGSSSSSSSSDVAGRKRRPLSKSPAPLDKKKTLSRSSRITSDSESSLDAFGKSKLSKKTADRERSLDKKQPERRVSGSLEAKRSTKPAEESERSRGRLESDRDRDRLPLDKEQKRSPRDLLADRSRQDSDKSPGRSLNGRPSLEKSATDKKSLLDKKPSGGLESDKRAAKTTDDFGRSSDPSRGRNRTDFETDLRRSPRDSDRSRGRAETRSPPDLERGRGRTDSDKSLKQSPRNLDRNLDRFDIDKDRSSRFGRFERDEDDLAAARSGRLDKGLDRSDLSRSGRGGSSFDRGQDGSSLNRGGRSGLNFDGGQDRSDLSRSGRGGSSFDKDSDRFDFDKDRNKGRFGGGGGTGPLDNPRIVVTATDGRQGDPVVARSSGVRARQRSFNLD